MQDNISIKAGTSQSFSLFEDDHLDHNASTSITITGNNSKQLLKPLYLSTHTDKDPLQTPGHLSQMPGAGSTAPIVSGANTLL